MKKRRLFISINLPEKVKEALITEAEKLEGQIGDARFLKPESWHITLIFLGYTEVDRIESISSALREIASRSEFLRISFQDIIHGPPNRPRMIWLNGTEKTSDKLGILRKEIEKELVEIELPFKKEKRKMHAHITLARYKGVPNLDFPTDLNEFLVPKKLGFVAKSFSLMESHLARSGAQYIELAKFDFKGEQGYH